MPKRKSELQGLSDKLQVDRERLPRTGLPEEGHNPIGFSHVGILKLVAPLIVTTMLAIWTLLAQERSAVRADMQMIISEWKADAERRLRTAEHHIDSLSQEISRIKSLQGR